MNLLHISAECYPAAKAGGLGDVAGALPKYQQQLGHEVAAIIPKYHLPWMQQRTFNLEFAGAFPLGNQFVPYTIERDPNNPLGFPLYLVHIPGAFDRPGIYRDDERGWYTDNAWRFTTFQQAVLNWIMHQEEQPNILHCHDYHSGLIPFLIQHSLLYHNLRKTPTVFTIHNGEYHGDFGWEDFRMLPPFDVAKRGLIEWGGKINPLAAGVKNAWHVTTVSPNYLNELATYSNGLEWLFQNEQEKSTGILNGIDVQVWDPAKDKYLPYLLKDELEVFKRANKNALHQRYHFRDEFPIVTFIGRLVREKGADLLPDLMRQVLGQDLQITFLILGTGDPGIQEALKSVQYQFPDRVSLVLEYNEGLAHTLYAGSDFLLMPSRVEPCGLNQMYAMRYGTIPVVRMVGGLKDTVIDLDESAEEGRGIRFDQFNLDEAHHAIWRAFSLYHQPEVFRAVRNRIMEVDFSWERSAQTYIDLYEKLLIEKEALEVA